MARTDHRGKVTSVIAKKAGKASTATPVLQTRPATAMLSLGEGGVCYKKGLVVHENYQICNVTNKSILDQIDPRIPEVTFSCNADHRTCNFQFWVDQKESFYCALDTCSWDAKDSNLRNVTKYQCENIQVCLRRRIGSCVAKLALSTLENSSPRKIKGPASFTEQYSYGGSRKDGSRFEEPNMNEAHLIDLWRRVHLPPMPIWRVSLRD